jgi:hypothetical protein
MNTIPMRAKVIRMCHSLSLQMERDAFRTSTIVLLSVYRRLRPETRLDDVPQDNAGDAAH